MASPAVEQSFETPDFSGLERFIPPVLLRWPGFSERPVHQLAALFIDVAGFTRLSEILSGLGSEGAEILERSIALYFDTLQDVIDRFAGLPIKISGDALTVVFPALDGDLRGAAARAVACAVSLRSGRLPPSEVATPSGTCVLTHKIGVGAGDMLFGMVGDLERRSELVFAGEALEQAVAAEHHARSGEVWIAPSILKHLSLADWCMRREADGFGVLAEDLEPGSLVKDVVIPSLEPGEEVSSEEVMRYLALVPEVVRNHASTRALEYLCHHQRVAAMFAGFPNLELGSLASLETLGQLYGTMRHIVEAHGGFLSEFESGDKGAKLIALFGAPAMLENACFQASLCAQALREAARIHPAVTDLRVGLTFGRMYVGPIGCRSLAKYSALGDRMNLAARLMTAAGRWSILADKSLVEHTAWPITWGASRVLQVKGKSEPVAVCALQLPAGRARPAQVSDAFVGRRVERRQCSVVLESLRSERRGSVLQVVGSPGIGKTRVLELVRRSARRRGYQVLEWSGALQGVQPGPLEAWRPVFLDLIGAAPEAGSATVARYFERWWRGLEPDLRPGASLLASLAGVPWKVDPAAAGLPPERAELLRRRTLLELLRLARPPKPRVFLLDSAERLDEASRTTLLELAHTIRGMQLLVVVARRPVPYGEPDHFTPLRVDALTLALEPLSPRAQVGLARTRFGARRLDPELEAQLREHCGGNPLLLESWCDVLLSHGLVRIVDGVACPREGMSLPGLDARLEALILTQLERLPAAAQLALRVASVIGPSFTVSEVAELHPEPVPETRVWAHLLKAARAGLVRQGRGATGRLHFSRSEVREAIHDGLTFQLRRALHTRRAQRLLEMKEPDPAGERTLLLAQHYVYVEDPVEQQRAFTAAMNVCSERFDPAATVAWGRRVLETCDRLGDRRGFLELAPRLDEAFRQLGIQEEREALIRRWVDEARAAGAAAALSAALQQRARLLNRQGDLVGALTQMDEACDVARQNGDPPLLSDALFAASMVYGDMGRPQQALDAAEESLHLLGDAAAPLRRCHLEFARGYALTPLGRPDEAYQAYQRALALSRSTDLVWEEAVLLGNLGIRLWDIGHPEEGHENLVRSLELKRKIGDRLEIGISLINTGYSFLRLGDLARARTATSDAVRMMHWVGYFRGELIALSNLGEILCLCGELEEAQQRFSQAVALLEGREHRPLQLELWLRRGELELARGAPESARQLFEQALTWAVKGEAAGARCQALEGLAEAWRALGELEQAGETIGEALALLKQGPGLLTWPQRAWWRAARIMRELGRVAGSDTCLREAVRVLESEQGRLSSTRARKQLGEAFPWNRELLNARTRFSSDCGKECV